MRYKDLPFAGGDVLGNLSSVCPVIHEQQFNVLFVADQKFPEATRKHMTRLFGLLTSDLGHAHRASESASDTAINTSGLPPRFLIRKNNDRLDIFCSKKS